MRRLRPVKPLQTEGLQPPNHLTGHSSLVRKQGSVFFWGCFFLRADRWTPRAAGFIGSRRGRGGCKRAEWLEEFSAALGLAGQAASMTSLKIHPGPRLRLKGFPRQRAARRRQISQKRKTTPDALSHSLRRGFASQPPLVSAIAWSSVPSHADPSCNTTSSLLLKICCECKRHFCLTGRAETLPAPW